MRQKTIIKTPCGPMTLVCDAEFLEILCWPSQELELVSALGAAELVGADAHPLLLETRRQLDAYFAGRLETFELPVNPAGTTFQRQVWSTLQTIPYGTTLTYQALAEKLGLAGGARAVGAANGKNPVSIVIPCHRVIGSSGKLTGYAGGIRAKQFLLELELGWHRPPRRTSVDPIQGTSGAAP